MGIFGTGRRLLGTWAEYKITQLSGNPDTRIDSGGSINSATFQGQEITRDDLREIKRIRESGGVISQLVNAKSLMNFGTGVEWAVEDNPVEVNDEGEEISLKSWLENTFNDFDTKVLDIGEDSMWYPYGAAEIVENRAGGFSHVEPVEPWTILPQTDKHGNILYWEQEIVGDRGNKTERFDADEIIHFPINKSSARDKTGISSVLRSREEIDQFRENQQAIRSAIELHGFPQRHVKVGREGSAPIRDNELKRVRTLFDARSTDSDTVYVTGQDVEIDALEAENFEFDKVSENDMRQLALALGVPFELTGYGSDGLGSGMPADVRMSLFKLQIKANQRAYTNIWVSEVIRPILRDYTPFDHTSNIEMNLQDPITSEEDMASLISDVGAYMETNEARKKLDLEPKEDLEGEYGPPGEEGGESGGLDDIFQESVSNELDNRNLSEMDRSQYRHLAEGFGADVFQVIGDPGTGEESVMAIGVDFPNSGVYMDWNVDAWPDGEELSGPHVSEYDSIEDAKDVAQGEVEYLERAETGLDLSEAGDTDFSDVPEWDSHLMEMHEKLHDSGGETHLLAFSGSATPEFVKARIRDAILSGTLFGDIEAIGSDQRMQLREYFLETLQSDGWTMDGLSDQIEQLGVDPERADTIARTESHEIIADAREIGYEEKGQDDDRFYWTGDVDSERTTDTCKYLIAGTNANLDNPGAFSSLPRSDGTNPHKGGEPMPLGELKEHLQEVARADPAFDTTPREWTPHINCRKTFTRAPSGP